EDPENAVTVELVAIGGSGDSCLEAHGLASLFWIVVPTWPLPRGVLALYEVEALGCGRSTSLGPVQQWMLSELHARKFVAASGYPRCAWVQIRRAAQGRRRRCLPWWFHATRDVTTVSTKWGCIINTMTYRSGVCVPSPGMISLTKEESCLGRAPFGSSCRKM